MKERELYWGFSYHKQTLTLSIGASHENDYDITTRSNIAMKLEILINWFIFLTSVVFFALAINDVSANGYTFKRQVKEHLANAYRSYRVPRDYTDVAKSNRKDAERRNVNAQYNLGVMYSQGSGVAQDHAEAVKWYRKAAAQGAKMKLNNSDSSG